MAPDYFDHDDSIVSPYIYAEASEIVVDGHQLNRYLENYTGPFYLYSKHLLQTRLDSLRSFLPQDIRVHFAVKSNPNPEILSFLADKIDGFDIASVGELEQLQALKAPLLPVQENVLKKSASLLWEIFILLLNPSTSSVFAMKLQLVLV